MQHKLKRRECHEIKILTISKPHIVKNSNSGDLKIIPYNLFFNRQLHPLAPFLKHTGFPKMTFPFLDLAHEYDSKLQQTSIHLPTLS